MATGRDVFTLAYHLQRDGETVVQNLVGIAIVGVLVHDSFFVEWIRAPGSPNLYWALSDIPVCIESRKIVAGELRIPEYTLPLLKEIGRRVLPIDDVNELAQSAFAIDAGSRLDKTNIMRRAQLTIWASQTYEQGYRELAASGYSHDLLDQIPVLQLALLARWQRYQNVRDDLYKWTTVVRGPARERALQQQREIHRQAREATAPFDAFLPPLAPMYQAQLRQHRYLSALRAIEALRLYAARHGELPRTLADVREVPLPDDPVTNAPFVYGGGGNIATLTMVRHPLGADIEYEYRLRLRETQP
jgi:hypothetical protein